MLDLPHAFQEVVNFAPGNSAAGSCVDDDRENQTQRKARARPLDFSGTPHALDLKAPFIPKISQ